MSTVALTPLMRQYHEIKSHYPGTLLLFQVGDFYELFFEDAQKASAFLGITLTQRGNCGGQPIPLCGVPRHVIDHYMMKLVRGGFRVALCDQLEEAQPGKVVERGVTNVFTPGTLTDLQLLDEKSASYLAAVVPSEESYSLVCVEIMTGQFFITTLDRSTEMLFEAELARFLPQEILLPISPQGIRVEKQLRARGYTTTFVEDVLYVAHATSVPGWLVDRMKSDARAFVEHSQNLMQALTMLYGYLYKNQPQALDACKQGVVYHAEDFLLLDAATQRNLEIVKNSYDDTAAHTLFSVVDHAVTSMGSRTIKKWLLRPLTNQGEIEKRLDVVEYLVRNHMQSEHIRSLLREVGDLERTVGRIALRRAQLHDYRHLEKALVALPQIACAMTQSIDDFTELYALLHAALNDDTTQEFSIKTGYHPELDRLRQLSGDGAQSIMLLEKREQEATGITSLKIRYNGIHGYAFEVTKTQKDAVPAHYIRTQTLSNRERFTTQELKDLEYDIRRAQGASQELEQQIFSAVRSEVEKFLPALKKSVQFLARLDALSGFAQTALTYRYVRPTFVDQGDMRIVAGRHPVVEARMIGSAEQFIPNDTVLGGEQRMWVITGPNMGGKSTFLRQVALISILAQCGSFVPARSAQIPLTDRIFTRIGAADRVAQGKSTFLVEMEETALICHQATERSLVILDEVGRGTSTYDGLAIAQAVIEYIYTTVKARSLFATHYHELAVLTRAYPGIVAYHTASKQTPEGVLLLHSIVPGVAESSFGIAVAKSARLPEQVISRAQQILLEIQR